MGEQQDKRQIEAREEIYRFMRHVTCDDFKLTEVHLIAQSGSRTVTMRWQELPEDLLMERSDAP